MIADFGNIVPMHSVCDRTLFGVDEYYEKYKKYRLEFIASAQRVS